jgi:CTP synthase
MHQKFDPYLNVDPGTMNPYQHGEVFVTEDGAETDLDLGHYERFTDINSTRHCNYTAGRIYDSIIRKERRGDFLGGTVQVVPHVTTEICDCIRAAATKDVDVVISEIGGTVGDIESHPSLKLSDSSDIRKVAQMFFSSCNTPPYLGNAGEVKTKPNNTPWADFVKSGLFHILICRSEKHIDPDVRRKLALFCNVDPEAVIEALDAPHCIYEVPLDFATQELDTVIYRQSWLAGRQKEPASMA